MEDEKHTEIFPKELNQIEYETLATLFQPHAPHQGLFNVDRPCNSPEIVTIKHN